MQNDRTQMVEQQVRAWDVLDPAVLDAMQTIPRDAFLPEKLKNLAYSDVAFNIRPDFQLPSPSVQGKILQALELEKDDSIYQIGVGTAYLSVCLAFLGGHVTVTEGNELVCEQIRTMFQQLSIKNIGLQALSWDETLNFNDKKYDAIVSQYAFTQVPERLKKALTLNGRAVLFVGSTSITSCVRIERIGEDEWLSEDLFETEVSPFPQKTRPAFNF